MDGSRRAWRRGGLGLPVRHRVLSGMMLALAGCHGLRVHIMPMTQMNADGSRPAALVGDSQSHESRHADVDAPAETTERGGWFVELGARQYHPRLKRSESLIDRRLAGPNTILFPKQFKNVETFDDLADAGRLWLPTVGVGKRVEPWLTLSGQFMVGYKRIDNYQRLNGLFTVDADFDAALYSLSFNAALLPLGQPARAHDGSLWAVLRGARPAIDQGIEVEYLSAEGNGGFKALGLGVDRVQRAFRDWNVSYNPGISWEFPLNEASSVVVGGNYNFHVYRPAELNGWNLILSLRYELP